MKKTKLKVVAMFLAMTLALNATYAYIPVYANEYTDAFWEVVGDIFVFLGTGISGASAISSGDFKKLMENAYLVDDKWNKGLTFDEWFTKNFSKSDNGQIYISEDLMKFLEEFITEYATQHPEEVEKINYRIIHTATYEQMFKDTMNYGNTLKGDFTVPEGSNTMEFWEKLWLTQNEYDSFPHLLSAPALTTLIDPEKTQDITIGQFFTIFDNYEKNLTDPTKTSCFIGEFGGSAWGDETQYHIKVCTYDYTTGSITIDRFNSSNQNVRFVWDPDNKVWNGTESGHYLFSSSSNAYVNVSYNNLSES